jgi:hypothetical protein
MNVVQCSCVGSKGRFGNAMFQYAVVRSYAEKYNVEFRCPLWIGEKIFTNVKNSPLLSMRYVDENDLKFGDINIDLIGFFQSSKFFDLLNRNKCKQWFEIQEKWKNKFPKNKNYYIACHLRRGDMVTGPYPTFTEKCYIEACKQFNYDPADIIWVSEDCPQEDKECNDLNIPFLPDYMTLLNADVVFRANSTFSFWGGLLGNSIVYSPKHDFPAYGATGRIDTTFTKGSYQGIIIEGENE